MEYCAQQLAVAAAVLPVLYCTCRISSILHGQVDIRRALECAADFVRAEFHISSDFTRALPTAILPEPVGGGGPESITDPDPKPPAIGLGSRPPQTLHPLSLLKTPTADAMGSAASSSRSRYKANTCLALVS